MTFGKLWILQNYLEFAQEFRQIMIMGLSNFGVFLSASPKLR